MNIQGHKDVPFRIIKRVMFSCQGGGYANINFAVLRGAGQRRREDRLEPLA